MGGKTPRRGQMVCGVGSGHWWQLAGGCWLLAALLKGAALLLSVLQGISAAIGAVIARYRAWPIVADYRNALVGGALLIKTYWGEIKSFFTGFWEGHLPRKPIT